MFGYFLLGFVAAIVALILLRLARLRLTRVVVYEFQGGLRYRKGSFEKVLEPGQYWTFSPATVITLVDMRATLLTLVGQEVLTADGVPTKVSVVAEFQVADPASAINQQANYTQSAYLLLQLAVREIVSGSNADALLEGRTEFAQRMMTLGEPSLRRLGLKLISADLRDLVVSGDIKRSFAQVVKARKEGQAALERARGETAALRSLANAARMIQDNPELLPLRTLQAVTESSGNTFVIGVPSTVVPMAPKANERRADNKSKGEEGIE